MRILILIFLATVIAGTSEAQIDTLSNEVKDSLYIHEVERRHEPDKVLHAEPLYIDLIRDLGARKGEKEWNVAFGLTDNNTYDEYTALVEYEWAPVDRLGLEVELPFSFYYPIAGNGNAPGSKLNSLKLAAQYSFYVSEKRKTSMAIGYIHEFELTDFKRYGEETALRGNTYNPFFVAAKRWGNNFHTMLYTGPVSTQHRHESELHTSWQFNSNIHYMITGTRNFIGIEFNKSTTRSDFDMTIRPQMRVGIAENLMVGIVTGIPVNRERERFSSFIRLIYEPPHK
jgi:hypothetical protein